MSVGTERAFARASGFWVVGVANRYAARELSCREGFKHPLTDSCPLLGVLGLGHATLTDAAEPHPLAALLGLLACDPEGCAGVSAREVAVMHCAAFTFRHRPRNRDVVVVPAGIEIQSEPGVRARGL